MMVENLLKFTTLREIIQELARRLDEEQICKQENICQTIKEILKEKMLKVKFQKDILKVVCQQITKGNTKGKKLLKPKFRFYKIIKVHL